MSTLWQKALLYLGLVDEEAVAGDLQPPPEAAPSQAQVRTVPHAGERVAGRRVEPPVGRRPGMPDTPFGSPATQSAVRQVAPVDVRAEVLEAAGFADAKVLADRIRERIPVVLNLRSTDPDMVRRLIDFASGLTYALDGTMRKIAEGVILVLPPRTTLGRDERRRLADLGLYTTVDENG